MAPPIGRGRRCGRERSSRAGAMRAHAPTASRCSITGSHATALRPHLRGRTRRAPRRHGVRESASQVTARPPNRALLGSLGSFRTRFSTWSTGGDGPLCSLVSPLSERLTAGIHQQRSSLCVYLYVSLCVSLCLSVPSARLFMRVCVCVCVCVREGGREGGRERRIIKNKIHVCHLSSFDARTHSKKTALSLSLSLSL